MKDKFFKDHCIFQNAPWLKVVRAQPREILMNLNTTVRLRQTMCACVHNIVLWGVVCTVIESTVHSCILIRHSLGHSLPLYCTILLQHSYSNSIPTTPFVQVLDLVDEKTRKDLEAAADTQAINAILDRPTTRWMTHARCLRHPMNPHGCMLPTDSDMES